MKIENTIVASSKKNIKKRWGSQARTKLTIDDINQFQKRLEAVTIINRKLLFPGAVPSKNDPFLKLEEPAPQYDNKGIRTNTVEYRYREKLEKDKNILIHQLIQLNPTYTAPSNYKQPLYECILWFPVKQYPDANFIGAILGPRGNTQKRLEKETSCKIAIRGKGAEKNMIRRIKNPLTSELEEMGHHVYICAVSEEKLEKGIEAVKPLLKPQSELARMEQMKELALINGIYRFDIRCKECGEMGHKDFQCPQRKNTYFANVHCENCGEMSHPTKDCLNNGIVNSTQEKTEIDYNLFLAEIKGEDPIEVKKRAEIDRKRKLQRIKNEEKFESKKLKTSIVMMKPSVLSNEKTININNMSINDKRTFL